jgi:hypothetical protein
LRFHLGFTRPSSEAGKLGAMMRIFFFPLLALGFVGAVFKDVAGVISPSPAETPPAPRRVVAAPRAPASAVARGFGAANSPTRTPHSADANDAQLNSPRNGR